MYFLSHPHGDRLTVYAVQASTMTAAHEAAMTHFGTKAVTTRPCSEAEYEAFAK